MYFKGQVLDDDKLIESIKPSDDINCIYGISRDGIMYEVNEVFNSVKEMNKAIAAHTLKGFKVYSIKKANKPNAVSHK